MHPILNGILGGWSVNGVGRIQARVLDFGNVRLVGMTAKDLQKMYKYYFTTNATSGLTEIWMLPEDVRLNTRRAYSTSTSSVDGYSTSLGAPTGRYIAPANQAAVTAARRLKALPEGAPREAVLPVRDYKLAPRFGDLTFLRLYTGSLKSGDHLFNPRLAKWERPLRLYRMFANHRRDPIAAAGPGEIVAVVGFKGTVTGVHWETYVPVQEIQPVNHSNERGNPPSDAYDVSCHNEDKEVCEEKTIDRGNGYSEKVQDCHTETEQYCSYKTDEWTTIQTYTLDGRQHVLVAVGDTLYAFTLY